MKYRLLEFLCCPQCEAPDLQLKPLQVDTGQTPMEVLEGVLTCGKCASVYPVIDGIPRMLPQTFDEPTQQTFSFEWLRYEVTSHDENAAFFRQVTGIGPRDLEGKLVLDAGCGMGRFLEVAAGCGGEVIGIDLSRSVERAWRETRYRPNVHFIQGDLMKLPLRRDIFDFVYSIGVLHHTPDTGAAFRKICSLLRPGGRIAVWVYRTFQPEIQVSLYKRAFAAAAELVNDGLRLVTTRLPHYPLHLLCYAAAPVGWVQRKIHGNAVLKHIFWPLLLLPFSTHARWRFRLCETFDWLAPHYQWKHTTREVMEWFQKAGLGGVRAMEREVSVTGVKAGAAVRAPKDASLGRNQDAYAQ